MADKIHECSICNFKTAAKDYLKIHIKRVHIANGHKCDICQKELANEYSVRAHKSLMHKNNIKRYEL